MTTRYRATLVRKRSTLNRPEQCIWKLKEIDDLNHDYVTSCGQPRNFQFTNHFTLKEFLIQNKVRYCYVCGGRVSEALTS